MKLTHVLAVGLSTLVPTWTMAAHAAPSRTETQQPVPAPVNKAQPRHAAHHGKSDKGARSASAKGKKAKSAHKPTKPTAKAPSQHKT